MKLRAAAVFFVCLVTISGCSVDPRSGRVQGATDPVPMSMWVLASGNESWVRWEAANVDSNGAVSNWELIAFLTQPNADGEITVGPDTYRYYSASQVIFNWTRAKTGYTGGCGNVPNSCPEHALIRATVGYPSGVVVPAIVFRENGGLDCIINNLAGGALSVASDCQISGADGIVVIFSEDG